jgi:hypothetical protein
MKIFFVCISRWDLNVDGFLYIYYSTQMTRLIHQQNHLDFNQLMHFAYILIWTKMWVLFNYKDAIIDIPVGDSMCSRAQGVSFGLACCGRDITHSIKTKTAQLFHVYSNIYRTNNIHQNITRLWLVDFSAFNPKQQCNNL